MDGILASWAVPKGPSMDPKVRRLAVHLGDHPLDYFDFEGVIPEGNYGAGDVIVWDWGTWEPGPGEDPGEAVRAGRLHLELRGVKLSGRFMLIRSDRNSSKGDTEQWLLFRKRDEASSAEWDINDHPRSVKTGRTNDEMRARPVA